MKANRASATLIARQRGCLLESSYDRINGFDLLLWAPDGMAFKGIGARCSADLAGQGCLRDEMDWSKTIESIERTAALGFDAADDDEDD